MDSLTLHLHVVYVGERQRVGTVPCYKFTPNSRSFFLSN